MPSKVLAIVAIATIGFAGHFYLVKLLPISPTFLGLPFWYWMQALLAGFFIYITYLFSKNLDEIYSYFFSFECEVKTDG